MLDAVISGSGINSAVIALLLDQAGLKVKIIDNQSAKLSHSLRTVTLNLQSMKLFKSLGIDIEACPIKSMLVRDAVGTGKIEFDAKDVEQSELAFTVYYSELIQKLNTKINHLTTDYISKNIHSASDTISIELLNGDTLDAKLLIASNSKPLTIKNLFSLSAPDEYKQLAATFLISSSQLVPTRATQVFYNKDIFALMPIHKITKSKVNTFSVVWSLEAPEDSAIDYVNTNLKKIEDVLGAKLLIDSDIETFSLKKFIATKYFTNRSCLIGDAAHVIHPMAGQGLNLGLADCYALYSEINKARNEGIDIGSSKVLKRYEIKRKLLNDSMIKGVHRIHALFQSDNIYIRVIRNSGFLLVNNINPLKKFFIKSAEGIFDI